MESMVLNAWFYKQMAIWSRLLNRTDMALEYWRKVSALRPQDSAPIASIAFLEAQRGDRPAAILALQQALAMNPEQTEQWYNLGYLQQQSEQHEDALKSFERAVKLNEKHDLSWYGRGISLMKLERVEEAIKAFRKNTVLQPLSPYGFYQLAHAYLRQGDTERVRRTIKQVSGFEPQVALQLQRETGVDAGVKEPFK
jgi:tetratricopeptide (TPR) repeat protein